MYYIMLYYIIKLNLKFKFYILKFITAKLNIPNVPKFPQNILYLSR